MLFALCAALGVAGAGRANDPVLLGQVLAVVIAFVIACVATNDLADERIDRVNLAGSNRPLVTGTADRSDLRVIAIAAATIALATSASLGIAPLAVTAAGLAISSAYSVPPVRIADRGGLAALVLPGCYLGVPYLLGRFAAGAALDRTSALTLVGLYLGFVARLLLKDFRDVRGDAMFGKRTFLVRHGRRPTCVASAIAWTVGAGLLTMWQTLASTAGLALATLALLAALTRDRGPRRDERIVGALAILGRGLLVNLLSALGMQQAHWGPVASAAMLAVLTVVTAGAALEMGRTGPRLIAHKIDACILASSGPGSRASSAVPMPASRP
jgi:4-hydroxybenzoate polyprenyltransferase